MECKAPRCKHHSPFVVAVVHVKPRSKTERHIRVCDVCLAKYIDRRDAGEEVQISWLAV
jgi:hypothetical protein